MNNLLDVILCDEKKARIRELNDTARQELKRSADKRTVPSIIVYPQYFTLLTEWEKNHIEDYVKFANPRTGEGVNCGDNEHKYGVFKFSGVPFHWKIDYWDMQLLQASVDPADINVTIRVLTINLGDIR